MALTEYQTETTASVGSKKKKPAKQKPKDRLSVGALIARMASSK